MDTKERAELADQVKLSDGLTLRCVAINEGDEGDEGVWWLNAYEEETGEEYNLTYNDLVGATFYKLTEF